MDKNCISDPCAYNGKYSLSLKEGAQTQMDDNTRDVCCDFIAIDETNDDKSCANCKVGKERDVG